MRTYNWVMGVLEGRVYMSRQTTYTPWRPVRPADHRDGKRNRLGSWSSAELPGGTIILRALELPRVLQACKGVIRKTGEEENL